MDAKRSINALVHNNLNIIKILEELSFPTTNDQKDDTNDFIWLCPALRETITCVQTLSDAFTLNEENEEIYLSKEEKLKSKLAIDLICHVLYKEIDKDEFIRLLCSNVSYFPLELLFLLDRSEIMNFEDYLTRSINDQIKFSKFKTSVEKLFLRPNFDEACTKSLCTEIMVLIVESNFGDTNNVNIQEDTKVIQRVLEDLLTTLLKTVVMSSLQERNVPLFDRVNMVSSLLEFVGLDTKVLKRFASYFLSYVLRYHPSILASDAIIRHHTWLSKLSSPFFVGVMQKVFIILEPSEVIEVLRTFFNYKSSWQTLLVVISCWTLCTSEAVSLLTDLVDDLLKEAFATTNTEILVIAFLLIRHLAADSPLENTNAYISWFKKSFSHPNSLANSTKGLTFLLNFLSDLVPSEKPEYLRVHLAVPPFTTQKNRNLLNDYFSLVKSRMKYLNEPLEQVGSFAAKIESKARADVKLSLEWFAENKKIPQYIFEASMFKKPYYIGQFLPALLQPQVLSDIPDVTSSFIDKLREKGKIPEPLYLEYKRKCVEETNKVLEDVILSDASYEEPVTNPLEELEKKLKAFCERLFENVNDHSSLISQLSIELEAIIKTVDNINFINKQENVNLEALNSYKSLFDQFPEHILNCFYFCRESLKEISFCSSTDLLWSHQFVSMLKHHLCLKRPIMKYLWLTFESKDCLKFESKKSESLSLFLYLCGKIFGNMVSLRGDQPSITLPVAVFQHLELNNTQAVNGFLQLASNYLKIGFRENPKNEDFVKNHIGILKMFQFAIIYVNIDLQDSKFCVYNLVKRKHSLEVSKEVQKAMEDIKLTFKECISFECKLKEEMLPAEERLQRIRYWCSSYMYLQPSDYGVNYQDVLSHLFCTLVESKKEIPNHFLFLTIIQEFIYLIKPGSSNTWLLDQFQKIFGHNVIGCDNQLLFEKKLSNFFSVCRCLPPWCILTDQPSEMSSMTSLQQVVIVINQWLRSFSTKCGFISKTLSLYFCHAINQTKNADIVFDFLYENSPLLFASVIFNWPLTGLYPNTNSKLGLFWKALQKSYNTIKTCDTAGLPSIYDHGLNSFLTSLLVYRHGGLILISKSLKSKKASPEALCFWAQFLMAEKSQLLLTDDPGILGDRELQFLSSLPPGVLQRSLQITSPRSILFDKIFSGFIASLFPFSCLLALLQLWNQERQSLPMDVMLAIITLMLENITQCNKLTSNELKVEQKNPLDSLELVIRLNHQVVDALKEVPSLILKGIAKDTLQNCDLHIKMFIKQRLEAKHT